MLIIDGYNLLFVQKGTPTASRMLEGMREKLIKSIKAYCLEKRCKAKIFFDAKTMTMITNQRKAAQGPVEIIYTKESADIEIKAAIKGTGIMVITSDNEILSAARKKRAKFMRSDEFIKELDLAKPPDRYQKAKESGISSEEAKYWLKEFGMDEK